jgi:hypothetical protein
MIYKSTNKNKMAKPTTYPCRMLLKIDNLEGEIMQIVIGQIINSEEEYLNNKRLVLKELIKMESSNEDQCQALCEAVLSLLGKAQSDEDKTDEIGSINSLGYIWPKVTFSHDKETIFLNISWTTQITWDSVDAKDNSGSLCENCHELFTLEKLSKCSGCKLVCYCSKSCQKNDWKRHKKICKKH